MLYHRPLISTPATRRRTLSLSSIPAISLVLVLATADPCPAASDLKAPAAHIQAAEEAFFRADFKSAIEAWSRAADLYAQEGDRSGEARSLKGVGLAHLKLSSFEQAEEYLRRAQKLYMEAEDLAGEAACITNLADVLRERGDLDRSLKLRQRALELREQINDDPGKAIDLVGLAQIYGRKGMRRKAVDTYAEALKIFYKYDSREGIAAAVSGTGVEYWKLGAYDMALICHENARDIHQSMTDDIQLAKDFTNIGNVYKAVSDHLAANEQYTKAFHIQQRLGNKAGAARSLVNLGISSKNLGRYDKALQQLREAFAIFKEIGSRSGVADCYGNLGVLFKNIGALKKAETYHTQALKIHEGIGDEPGKGADLANLGVVYALRKQNDRALEFFDKARKIFEKTGNKKEAAIAAGNAAALLAELDDPEAAKEKIKEASAIYEELKYNAGLARCMLAAGTVELHQGRHEEARKYCEDALALSHESREPQLASECSSELARSMVAQGKTSEAVEMYTQAIRQMEKLRRNVGSFQLASAFLHDRSDVYHELVALLASRAGEDADSAGRAFRYLEKGRARSFLDMLTESGADVREGADPDLLRREKFLLARMAAINETIADEAAQGELGEARRQALEGKLQDTETDYHRLEVVLREKCPKYAELYYPETLTARQVQEMLSPDDVLLEYALGEDNSFVFALTREKIGVYELPPRDAIRRQVGAFREIVLTRRSRAYCAPAHSLYELLVEPAAELVEGKRRIIVVPDDHLHYLAFECLLTETPARVDFSRLPYLLRKAVISYAPSATVLAKLSGRQNSGVEYEKDILICADPDYGSSENEVYLAMRDTLDIKSGLVRLPYSALEARNVSSVFSKEGVVLLNRASASEQRLKNMQLSGFKYIDFATHAVLNEERPEFSSIVLAQTPGKEDGLLQMQEILNLKLNARLVTLSACSTARGKLINGEGVVGLSRALFYAGTPAVVASLWNVNDASTSKLMGKLFEGLQAKGLSPDEALRQAKLSLINTRSSSPFAIVPDRPSTQDLPATGSYSHPFYWAAFVLIGE